MKDHEAEVNNIKKSFSAIKDEQFIRAASGTHHDVYISKDYVIRFRDDDPQLLEREASLLKSLDHPIIPKVSWMDAKSFPAAMIERRLPGRTIDSAWKSLTAGQKENIVSEVIDFLRYMRTIHSDSIYSVQKGKKYSNFVEYLTDGIKEKIERIRKFDIATAVIGDIASVVDGYIEIKPYFTTSKYSLVHGDLIIHNLLTDSEKLTGVLDWELALYGDPDDDLFRLFYYQECAAAYRDRGVDETFEAEYMDMLVDAISRQKLIGDEGAFRKKHDFVRAIFFINALSWDAQSSGPEENLKETINLWNKK